MDELIILKLTLLLTSAQCIWASKMIRPKTAVVMVGTNFTFECSSSREAPYWSWYISNKLIIDGNGCHLTDYSMRFKYQPNATGFGVCNLLVIDITLKDSGQYSCSDNPNYPRFGVASLIVIGRNLTCSSSQPFEVAAKYDDLITLRCALEYNDTTVSNMPQLSWNTGEKDSITYHEYPNVAVNAIEKRIHELISDLHPILPSLKCTASMKAFSLPNGFDPVCETNQISVFYPPRNIKIVLPASGNVRSGDEISCVANSNPSSIYLWRGEGIESISGQTISIKKSGVYNCTAHNSINGILHNQTVSATIYVDGSLPYIPVIFITIAVTVIGLLIVYLIAFCVNIDFKISIIV